VSPSYCPLIIASVFARLSLDLIAFLPALNGGRVEVQNVYFLHSYHERRQSGCVIDEEVQRAYGTHIKYLPGSSGILRGSLPTPLR
jgi:hypothetical protein